jgi:hypothetical protein
VTDLDCALGARCDTVSSRCAIIGASFKYPYTVELANGQEQSCSPYQCLGGACADACTADGDCAPGYECMAPTCVAMPGSGGSAGSGGSQTPGASGDTGDETGGSSTGAGGEMPGASGNTPGSGGSAERPVTDSGCGCRLGARRDARGPSSLFALALALSALRYTRRRRKDLSA